MTAPAPPATLSTGIPALDAFLRGGLPRGFTTLVVAPPGSGAEILAKQFAANHPTERVVYLTTDESKEEVEGAIREAHWDFGTVAVVDIQSEFADAMMAAQEKAREASPGVHSAKRPDPRELVEGTHSLDLLRGAKKTKAIAEAGDYLGRLLDPYAKLRPPDRMVVHSLDFFLNLYSVEQVVSILTALKAANARQKGLHLWVLAKGGHSPTVERRLELLADCLIELEVSRKGTTFERFFMVKKVKNRAHGIGVATYEVTPNGIQLETLERIV